MKEELLKRLKKEFVELKNIEEDRKISTLIYNHIHEIKEEDTNKIYVFSGAITDGNNVDVVDIDNPSAKYVLYWNVEQFNMKKVLIEEYKNFEKDNIIVYGKHHKIMLDFFKEAIKTNQEDATKLIKKIYKKRK